MCKIIIDKLHSFQLYIFFGLIVNSQIPISRGIVLSDKYSSKSNDICGLNNGRRIYLELGDFGEIKASNVTIPIHSYNYNYQYEDKPIYFKHQCSLELVTCPSCIINILIRHMNFTTECQIKNEPPCMCDYLLFYEPPYNSSMFGMRVCNQEKVYRSKTRTLGIHFIYQTNNDYAFSLQYSAERNRESITGPLGDLKNITELHHIISTPFFPTFYPRDYGIEHTFVCNVAMCRIRVIFTDFQIGVTSQMEMYDSNGQRTDVFTGAIFRPPVIVSSGSSMMIRFYGNGGTGYGYRANITFLTLQQALEPSSQPFTDCGGYVESLGGAITMMNMITNNSDIKIYDCVWLIKPPDSFQQLKTHLSLKVHTFKDMAGISEIIIRQGTTSNRPVLDRFEWPSINDISSKSYIVSLNSGFYVSMNAVFSNESRLAIIFTAFSYMDCYIGSEFLCKNHRCIPFYLQCDGFDHCGDNSDEPVSCYSEFEPETIDRSWYSHTPNYYFPKIEHYPDLKTATMIFIFSSMGLLILIAALIILLYRMGARARQQRHLNNQLQTISELLDNNHIRREEIYTDEPPIYEAPPDYEEVIKIGMEEQILQNKRNRRKSEHKNRVFKEKKIVGTGSDVENSINSLVLPLNENEATLLEYSTTVAASSPQPCSSQLTAITPDDIEKKFLLKSNHLEASTPSSTSGTTLIYQFNEKTPIPESPPPAYGKIGDNLSEIDFVTFNDHEISNFAKDLDVTQSFSLTKLQTVEDLTSSNSSILKNYQQKRKSWHSFRGINDDKSFIKPEIITTFDYNNINQINACLMSNSTIPRNFSFREKLITSNSAIGMPILPINYKNEHMLLDLLYEREKDIDIGIIYNSRKMSSCDFCVYKLSNENILNGKETTCNECLNKYFNVTSAINIMTNKSTAK